jgi:hypothetical protein
MFGQLVELHQVPYKLNQEVAAQNLKQNINQTSVKL